MEIPKEAILKLIRERLGGDKAQEADQELPDQVDPEQHSDLLSKFGSIRKSCSEAGSVASPGSSACSRRRGWARLDGVPRPALAARDDPDARPPHRDLLG